MLELLLAQITQTNVRSCISHPWTVIAVCTAINRTIRASGRSSAREQSEDKTVLPARREPPASGQIVVSLTPPSLQGGAVCRILRAHTRSTALAPGEDVTASFSPDVQGACLAPLTRAVEGGGYVSCSGRVVTVRTKIVAPAPSQLLCMPACAVGAFLGRALPRTREERCRRGKYLGSNGWLVRRRAFSLANHPGRRVAAGGVGFGFAVPKHRTHFHQWHLTYA